MDLKDLLAKAKGLFHTKEKATDVVVQDRWDVDLFNQIVEEVPRVGQLIDELQVKHPHVQEMIRDIATLFYQAAPEVRTQDQMDPDYLTNHAVLTGVSASPETITTRSYTQHDKYGAAMGVLSVVDHIKELLDKPPQDESQEAGEQAAEADDLLTQALEALGGAMGGAEGGQQGLQEAAEGLEEAMGGYEGEGPLTEAQNAAKMTVEEAQKILDEQAEALQEALDAAEQAAAGTEEARTAAEQAANVARDNLATPLREGIAKAAEDLEAEQALFRAWGIGPGELQNKTYAEREALSKMLKDNRLSRFADLMGRFRMAADAQKMKKVEYGRDEMYTTELSGDLDRILDSELALLAIGDDEDEGLDMLQMLAMLDFVEDNMISRKYRGSEKIGKGAIICLVDTSGSMETTDRFGITREAWAKAFALALLDIAAQSRRDFVGIIFSSTGEQQVYHFPRGRGTIEDKLSFANKFYDGGTDFEEPLELGMDILEQQYNDAGKSKGDLVMITDDDYPRGVAAEWMEGYQARKKRLDFRTWGIGVGLSQPGSTLAAISDNVRTVKDFADPASVVDIMQLT